MLTLRPDPLASLLGEIRACQACALPHGARPVLQAGSGARVLVIGQAPGARVHASGIPWDDRSGDRLRKWMAVSRATFYDPQQLALVPMGFCYPGKGASGDLPPRRECAPLWQSRLLALLPKVRLTLLVGQYAQARHVPGHRRLTDTLRRWRELGEAVLPLPHPSPRNIAWFQANPWFAAELLPVLQQRVRDALASQ